MSELTGQGLRVLPTCIGFYLCSLDCPRSSLCVGERSTKGHCIKVEIIKDPNRDILGFILFNKVNKYHTICGCFSKN